MIVMERETPAGREDVFTKAGREAEEQMAHYLRRAYGESKSVFVLHGLRLERGEDAAQIDHLIIHRAGLVIVESKSVHGRVRVNEHGEWVRVYGSRQQGMPSPIEQAKRQARFLIQYLNDHAPQLTGKMLGLVQAYFGAVSYDIIVAISDTGIIDRPNPKKLPLPEVCKADQAVAKVEEALARQRREAGLLTGLISPGLHRGRGLTRGELENILAFLPAHHRPLRAPETPAEEVVPVSSPGEGTVASEPASAEPASAEPTTSGGPTASDVCAVCGRPLTEKVAAYCRDNAERFGGSLLCFEHQRSGRRRRVAAAGNSPAAR